MQEQWNKIRLLREQLLFTQKEFAKILGVSRQTVNNWETGKCAISNENCDKIKKIVKNCKKFYKNA